VQRSEAPNILRDVAQAKGERCRGAPSENLLGDRFSGGELRHDVGEGEEHAAQVVMCRSVTQECVELLMLLHAPIVDGGMLSTWKIGCRRVQPQSPQGVDDGVGAGCVGRAFRKEDALQTALQVDDEVQVTEAHGRARDPSSGIDGHPPPGEKMNETRKRPLLGTSICVALIKSNSLCSHRFFNLSCNISEQTRLIAQASSFTFVIL